MLNFKDYIRDIPNFPKTGVIYKDITPLFLEPHIVKLCVDAICDNIPNKELVNKVIGIESRGFLLSSLIAQKLNAGLVLARKKGKLPYKTFQASYSLEYGEDILEIHTDAVQKGDQVVIHDDVLATGGTAAAANQLVESCGGQVVQNNFLIELSELNGRDKLYSQEIFSLISY